MIAVLRRFALRAALAGLAALVLATSVYQTFERVRVRVVTQMQAAGAPSMTVEIPAEPRFGDEPVAVILRVTGGARAVDLSVRLDEAPLTIVRAPAGRTARVDLSLPRLRPVPHRLTLSGDQAGWALTYLEIANVHGYTASPVEVLIAPRSRWVSSRLPWWGWLVVVSAMLGLAPSLTWPARSATYVHRIAAATAVALLAVALLSPLLTPYRVLLSLPAFACALVVIYARPLSRPLVWLALRAPVRRDPPVVAPLPGTKEILKAGVGLMLVVGIVLHTQVLNLGAVPDLGDPLFSMWRVGWVLQQLGRDPARLFDANIFHPAPTTLAYSDAMILPALTAAPLLWAGLHPVVTYNLVLLSGFVLSGIAAYVLGRGLGFERVAAWIGGVIFALHPYRLDHYAHLELQMAHWMPLALLGIHRILATGRHTWILATALALGAQWYSSMYYGLFLSLYAAVFAAVLAWSWRAWRRLGLAAFAVVLGAILAAPLAAIYARAPGGERPPDAVRSFSAVPSDYLRPPERSALYADLTNEASFPERALFPGALSPALAVAGAWPPGGPARLALLAGGLFAFDGSLGLNGLVYPALYEHVPLFRSIRVPARFAVLVGLTLALLSAAALDRWQRSRWGRGVPVSVAFAVLTVAVAVDAWPSLRLVSVWRDPPGIYAALPDDREVVLFEYPMSPEPLHFAGNLPFMYFSLWHFHPMVNGYSGFLPQHYQELARSLDGFPGGETLARLRHARVTHITVICALDGPMDDQLIPTADPAACAGTLAQLDADPGVRPVTRDTWQGAPAILYELRTLPPAAPAPQTQRVETDRGALDLRPDRRSR